LYLYEIGSGADCSQQTKLIADEGTAANIFARGVTLQGDTALVAASIADAGGARRNVAYVFTRSGDVWTPGHARPGGRRGAGRRLRRPRVSLSGALAVSDNTILIDGQQDPLLEDTAFAASVSSTVPIIVERAMWWGPTSESWYEAHASLGTTETGTVFGIGEAQSGGEAEEDTYVLVSNASDTPAPVRFTLIYDDGTTEEKTLEVGGSTRLTALMTTEFPASDGRRFSILVESVDQVPITVEVSRYQSTDGLFGNVGGTAHATKIQ
jgi:hypothetical protein